MELTRTVGLHVRPEPGNFCEPACHSPKGSEYMEYTSLDGIPTPLSRIVQGTVMISSDDLTAAGSLLDVVYAQGGRTFDTAHGYGLSLIHISEPTRPY